MPFTAAETVRRGRLGPGELLLVEPGRRAILEDAEAKAWVLRSLPIHDAPRPVHEDRGTLATSPRALRTLSRPTTRCATSPGLDAERARLDIKTMTLEGHEPLWSMGDDTPTPGRAPARPPGRRPPSPGVRPGHQPRDRPRARARRHGPAGGARPAAGAARRAAARPAHGPAAATDRRGPRRARPCARRGRVAVRTLDATWDSAGGPAGLEAALDRLAAEAVAAARRATEVLVLTDEAWSVDRLPVPSILATGAVHTALTAAGLRGRTDVAVSAVDVLDVHAMAMVLAVGATAVHPRLAIELAAELAGTRGAETLTPDRGRRRAWSLPSRPVCARRWRGWASAPSPRTSAARSSTSIDLDASVVERCFPTAAAWPGRTTLADIAERQLRRRSAALAIPEPAAGREARLPDPGFARFRGDGEAHLFSPRIAGEIQVLAAHGIDGGPAPRPRPRRSMTPSRATGRRSPGRSRIMPSRGTSCASGRAAVGCRPRRTSRTRRRSCGASSSRR